ncbi:hypothetical protein ACLOJK_031054 [Asimina triloba]
MPSDSRGHDLSHRFEIVKGGRAIRIGRDVSASRTYHLQLQTYARQGGRRRKFEVEAMASSAARRKKKSSPSRDLCRILLKLLPFCTEQRSSSSHLPPLRQVTVGKVLHLLLSSSLSLSRSLSTPLLFLDIPASSLSLPVSILLRSAGLLPLSPCLAPSRSPLPSCPLCPLDLPIPAFPLSLSLFLRSPLLPLSPCLVVSASLLPIPPPAPPNISPSLHSLSPRLSFSARPSSLSRPVSSSPPPSSTSLLPVPPPAPLKISLPLLSLSPRLSFSDHGRGDRE